MTDQVHPTSLLTRPIAIDATRIPPTPPGVASHREAIAAAAMEIAQAFHPDRIVLFGSRAYGTPRPDSDIDLMVVMETQLNLARQADLIRKTLDISPAVRLQILVRQPDDIARRLSEGDFFIEDVMCDGITLYARDGMVDPQPTKRRQNPSADEPKRLTAAAKNWLTKSEEDEGVARFLLTSPVPRFNAVCFHAQQSTENALKGLLEQHAIRFPRTHDLVALAALAHPLAPTLATHTDALKALTNCSVDARYPGAVIDATQADAALTTMDAVSDLVRTLLNLDGLAE